jgi:hypothetical protein
MSELVIQNNLTIYDLALQTGYTLDYIYKLIQQNDFLESVDTTPPKLKTITYDNSFVPKTIPKLTVTTSNNTQTVDSLQKLEGQSIYDICLQSYGSLDLVYKLIQDNFLVNVDETIETGKVLNFTITDIVDIGLYKLFKKYSTSITSIPIIPPINFNNYLLQEDGYYILQETGFKIIL